LRRGGGWGTTRSRAGAAAFVAAATGLAVFACTSGDGGDARDREVSLLDQDAATALAKSHGCVGCHSGYEQHAPVEVTGTAADAATLVDDFDMHRGGALHLGCVDCHGGDAAATTKEAAHPQPLDRELWTRGGRDGRGSDGALSSANPQRPYARTLHESPAWIRFVNPGDLRAAPQSCGTTECHAEIVTRVRGGMMAHGAMLWGAALYANGAVAWKDARYGEAYTEAGEPAHVVARPAPTAEEQRARGWLPELLPLERWETSLPGNVLRAFERGGRRKPEIGLPNPFEPPGDPEAKLSTRGFGTQTRTDPVFLGLQKTRLLDPTLNLFGTNDHPGDYRASGCSACHVVYANDRDPAHSGSLAAFGNGGRSASGDPTIARDEPGHPLSHAFTRAIPSSQCIVCHVHPGTSVTNSYYGTLWWDNETDGERMYPATQPQRSDEEQAAIRARNPEGAALRGRWSDPEFLAATGTPEFNATLEHTRFADFHGHGWLFRKVWQRDRHGVLLDRAGAPIPDDAPDKFERAVHLMDIHLEQGMHCVDCHFEQDSHGTGRLHGEVRGAIEIDCDDCHGTVDAYATLRSSGPAAPPGGSDLARLTTPSGQRRFFRDGGRLFQRSVVEPGKQWEVVQVLDTVTPGAARYNAKSARAKTVRAVDGSLAHRDSRMACAACHTSWTTSCFGCHLPMEANRRTDNLHHEGQQARNWTSYDFQTLREDCWMLGVDGTVAGGRISPARSSCAVLVSSRNEDREWIYSQQQTVSAEGFSGHAFSTYVPHTVRGKGATKRCSDCHVSAADDNNAWMAQLLLQGTNQTNFIGRHAWVATGAAGFAAVVVTERDAPQAVIGSNLHRIAYPEEFAAHVANGRALTTSVAHGAGDVLDALLPTWRPQLEVPAPAGRAGVAMQGIRSLQRRGEYLYAACGSGGLRVFDVANVDQKGLSEKVVSAPVSPLGQRLHVATRDARFVAAPATTVVDPTRARDPANEEGAIHPLYGCLYVADFEEGLVVVGAATLLNGDPQDNFLERVATFDGGGALRGATSLTIAGRHAWVCCAAGLAIVDLDDPRAPRLVATVGAPHVDAPTAVQVQFRYAFVSDARGLRVLDATDPAAPRPVDEATVAIDDARGLYVARTHAYVAAGRHGLAIVDVERPRAPRLLELFDGGGALSDTWDVKVGMTNNSLFGYVADGANGLAVLELVTSGATPGFAGFTQRPTPKVIARFATDGPALAISEGIDRDRAVDESGNQLSVFDRRGGRPLSRDEMERLYLRDGKLWSVDDDAEEGR